MMDGRVKTLHPALHGGILARRDRPDDLAALERHGLGLVDVVVVNLYPFVKAAVESGDAVRRAGRGDRHRRAVAGARGRQELPRRARRRRSGRLSARCSTALDAGPTLAFRFELMRKALAHTAPTTRRSRATLATIDAERRPLRAAAGRRRRPLADGLELSLEKIRDLRYGENPHQRAAWYRPRTRRGTPPAGLGAAHDPAGQGAVVHEPARSRRGRAHRARVRRAGGRRHQAHQPVRRGDRRRRPPTRTCARATPTAWPRSAASSRSTGRSTWPRPRRSSRRSSRR